MENINISEEKRRQTVLSYISILIANYVTYSGRERNQYYGEVIENLVGHNFSEIYQYFDTNKEKLKLKQKPKMSETILNYFQLALDMKIELEGIFLQNFCKSEKDLKNVITKGTNVYKVYDKSYNHNYWIFEGSDVGEFSGANVDSICDVIEINGEIKQEANGITKQNLEADLAKKFINRQHQSDKTDDRSVEKVIYVGYSKGANKATQCYLYDAAQVNETKKFNNQKFNADEFIEKHELILVNGLPLSNGTKIFFKDLLGKDNFDKLANKDSKNILNINNENDFVSPMNKEPYGKIIYFASKGVSHGHSLRDIALDEFVKSGKTGKPAWKYRLYSYFYDYLDVYIKSDRKIAYKMIKALFMFGEKTKFHCEKNVKDEPIEVQKWDVFVAICVCVRFFICAAFWATFAKPKTDMPKIVSVVPEVSKNNSKINSIQSYDSNSKHESPSQSTLDSIQEIDK